MEAITTAITDLLGIVGTVITTITGQPILCAFLAVSFVGIGIGLFRKLRH